MKQVHRIANIGEKIILNYWNKNNLNANKVLGNKIATVLEHLGFTKILTTEGEVYHIWYDQTFHLIVLVIIAEALVIGG